MKISALKSYAYKIWKMEKERIWVLAGNEGEGRVGDGGKEIKKKGILCFSFGFLWLYCFFC